MPAVIDTQQRSQSLDQELEAARKEVAALDLEEAQHRAREQAAYLQWIKQKADRFRKVFRAYLSLYDLVRELEDVWRRQVFRGEEVYSNKTDQAIRGLYGLWFAPSKLFEDETPYFRRHGQKFDSELDDTARNKRDALERLSTWEPPVLSLAPSLRHTKLSAEETAKLCEVFPELR